jgi:hypothetical protein
MGEQIEDRVQIAELAIRSGGRNHVGTIRDAPRRARPEIVKPA